MFRTQRRIGATLYFTLTFLAQLLLVAVVVRERLGNPTRFIMLGVNAVALIIGVISLIIDATTSWHDQIEDAIEWQLALLVHAWFICYYYWMKSR